MWGGKKKDVAKKEKKKRKKERSILFVNIRFIQRKLIKFCGEEHNKLSLHSNPLSQVTTAQIR